MLFNSIEFLLFLPLVFAVYWAMNRRAPLRIQNLLLLAASYLFYGWWDWRFLSLIAFSTLVDFAVGLQIAKANDREIPQDAGPSERSRAAKRWLAVSLAVNLGLLGYFKYANFFIESWVDAWAAAGVTMHASTLQIILPVGISFYTFQTLSYSIDIYRRQLQPTKDLIAFGAFLSFFPQLVAGPIERASKLLPQIERRRQFDYDTAVSGLRLILWGMFKKVVVADTCALYVNDIFGNVSAHDGPELAMGAVLFAFQIYGDFAGYSDIAIGTARLFGIRLMTNFRAPFFSKDMAEFRRRWHISLYTWFRDYIYIPLGGSKVKTPRRIVHVLIIFLVSGLWHGADWSFIAWSLINALLILPLVVWPPRRAKRKPEDQPLLPSIPDVFRMAFTFLLFCIPLVYFRAHNVHAGHQFLMRSLENWSIGSLRDVLAIKASVWIALLLLGDWVLTTGAGKRWALAPARRWLRWSGYATVVWWIFMKFDNPADFIYFQF